MRTGTLENSRYKLTNVSPEVVVAETVVLANPGTIVVYVPTSRLKGSQLLKVDGTALNPNAALIRSFLQSGIVVEG